MAASEPSYQPIPLIDETRQSPPVNLDIPYDDAWVKGKTILITGGASGFGAAFARRWAAAGATLILGDISVNPAQTLVRDIRSSTGNDNVHFVYCDVTDWLSQVHFFKEAVRLSPHGGIDTVVANAGISGERDFERPVGLDAAEPAKPNFKHYDVNLTGVLYTTHLALFWLPRNPNSNSTLPRAAAAATTDPSAQPRDRHILLMGSMASLSPIPTQVLYAVSKHGVLGLFRTLRSTAFVQGIRVNMLCPYFIETPIVSTPARLLLAGGGMGAVEDVVDAATRFVADSRIVGRALVVGPKMNITMDDKGEYQLAAKGGGGGASQQKAVWEAYAHDFEDSDLFSRGLLRLLNSVVRVRGWAGWVGDVVRAIRYGFSKAA